MRRAAGGSKADNAAKDPKYHEVIAALEELALAACLLVWAARVVGHGGGDGGYGFRRVAVPHVPRRDPTTIKHSHLLAAVSAVVVAVMSDVVGAQPGPTTRPTRGTYSDTWVATDGLAGTAYRQGWPRPRPTSTDACST
jgi:hypothetical protein